MEYPRSSTLLRIKVACCAFVRFPGIGGPEVMEPHCTTFGGDIHATDEML